MGEIAALIPEIYYDIIARIIPGIFFLGLYKFNSISTASTKEIFYGLICSYILGLLFHIISWRILYTLMKKLLPFFNFKEEKKHWDLIWNKPVPDRNMFTKMMAEKALFRNLSFASLILAIYPPCIFVCICCYPWIFGIVLFILFVLCMCTVEKWLNQNLV
jgi:hypothetical protein